MSRMVRWWGLLAMVAGGSVLCFGCGRPVEPVSVPPLPRSREMPEGEHLLLEPGEDPAALLGRAVRPIGAGGLVIAEALAPRCEVYVEETRAKWSDVFHQSTRSVAGFADVIGEGPVVAKRRDDVRLSAHVANQKKLVARLEGRCGDRVIDSVYVGTGSRAFEVSPESPEGTGDAVEAGGGRQISWAEPRAWAIGLTGDANRSELYIEMPEQVWVREPFTPRISTGQRDLWLIVLTCDGDEVCWVLTPSPELPDVSVRANATVSLPPLASGAPARERVVVYGFAEAEDYRRYAPKSDAMTDYESTVFANRLYARLKDGEISKERWTRAIFRYEVVARAE